MHALSNAATTVITAAFWPWRTIHLLLQERLTTLEIVLGGLGLVAALVPAAILTPALVAVPGRAGDFAPIGIAVILAPVGIAVALSRRAEVERWLSALRNRTLAGAIDAATGNASRRDLDSPSIVVDTSAIIDGRLRDIAATGFILGELVIPRFVLDELRHIADSPEPLRRQRGRRGLSALTRLQSEGHVRVTIDDQDFPEHGEVDAKVLALARARGAVVLTTDYNLSSVAGVENLRVLNFNGLAQAVRAQFLPGETLQLQIQQEGRERDQGVGFLDDGTMVVVEGGWRLLGQEVAVEVTRVIQTSAGRMVFTELEPVVAGPEVRG